MGHGAADVNAWLQGPTESAMEQSTRIKPTNIVGRLFLTENPEDWPQNAEAEHHTGQISDLHQLNTYISMVVQSIFKYLSIPYVC